MKLLILFATTILGYVPAALATSPWNALLTCESGHLEIDRGTNGFELVLRQVPGVLEYFGQHADIRSSVNARNELVARLEPSALGSPEVLGEYSGNLGGSLYVTVSSIPGNGKRVRLLDRSYRGTVVTELANWDFYGCSNY